MDHRIGSLHLHYRVRGGSIGAALAPSLDRALQTGLADAVNTRLAAMFGDNPSVIVVRELQSSVTLSNQDMMLDGRVVERVCASSVDALGRMLARDVSSESLVRFSDEAEFVGSFIVDLLAGLAWGHWYYGVFHRYRQLNARETIRIVFAESGVDASRVFAWLSRQGKLDAMLEFLDPHDALAIVDPLRRQLADTNELDGTEVLADAALQLLAALGWDLNATPRTDLISRFLATQPVAASWNDRRSLSLWVLGLIRYVIGRAPASTSTAVGRTPSAVHELLTGPLDWLDASWLVDRLSEMLNGDSAPRADERVFARPLLTHRQSRILEGLTDRLRDGRLRLPAGENESALVVRLLAAATEDLASTETLETLDRTLITAIEEVARACARSFAQAPTTPRDDIAREVTRTRAPLSRQTAVETTLTLEALRRYGTAAVDLLQALPAIPPTFDDPSEATQAGGLFLLLRALIDTRLPALARQSGIPLPPLLSALAIKWFNVSPPFDDATTIWVGADRPDFTALRAAQESLNALNETLLDILIDRHGLEARDARESIDRDAGLLSAHPDCSHNTDAAIAWTASLLMRAWAHWLRGVANSSSPFLLDNCLRRTTRARISKERIALELAPAPLDVVLQMAGYFERIDTVPWLGDRSVTFTVRRAP